MSEVESLLEEAFGRLPIPSKDAVPSSSLTSESEARWLMEAYGGKKYSELDPRVFPCPEGLTSYLSSEAYSYYIGGVALAAVRRPLGNSTSVLINSLSTEFEDHRGDVSEENRAIDEGRAAALAAALGFIAGSLDQAEDKDLLADLEHALKNLELLQR